MKFLEENKSYYAVGIYENDNEISMQTMSIEMWYHEIVYAMQLTAVKLISTMQNENIDQIYCV